MRVLYFYRVPLPDPRADAVQIVHTCAGMARAGAAVELGVETLAGPLGEVLRFYGVEPLDPRGRGSLAVRALGPRWSWPVFAWKTAPLLRRASGGPACLFVREVRPYVPGLMARARRAGLKAIFEAHNVSARLVEEKRRKAGDAADEAAAARLLRKARAREALERLILARADALVCTQEATRAALAPLAPAGIPITVLGNGTRLPPQAPAAARDIDLLYCGSLKPWKGVDTLVKALGDLDPHRLTIVGPGTPADLDRLRGVARAAGAEARLTFAPPVAPAQVWGFYARARVGVIPLPGSGYIEARDFTSPLKLFEMLAAGLPVVASRLPAIEAYVADGLDAVLVPPDDPAALAAALRRVLGDPGLRERLAAAGRARAAEHTWDARGRRLVELAARVTGVTSAG